MLTGDGLRRWSVVGNWLQKVELEFCFLAACRAGKSEAVRELFKAITTLRQILCIPCRALQESDTAAGGSHLDVAEGGQD